MNKKLIGAKKGNIWGCSVRACLTSGMESRESRAEHAEVENSRFSELLKVNFTLDDSYRTSNRNEDVFPLVSSDGHL